MIKVPVRTIWKGTVGVRDKYVIRGKKSRQGLLILHGDGAMVVAWEDLDRRCVGRSELPMGDRFSSEKHYLLYYDWKPMEKQAALL